MPPRQSETLTEAELRIMNVLWGKGSGTVQQVLDSISQKPALAYNSVLTTIRVLERKGYVKHLKDGRAHVYTPLVGQKDATRSEIRHLVSRFFKNSHEQLVLNLLEDQGIGPEDMIASGRCWTHNATLQNGHFKNYASEGCEMIWLSLQTVAQISVERILNALPEGFLIALFAWALLRVLRRQNSGTRFAVWFLALLTVAALPLLGGFGEGQSQVAVAGWLALCRRRIAGKPASGYQHPCPLGAVRFYCLELWEHRVAMLRLAARLLATASACAIPALPSSLADLDPAVRETVDAIGASGQCLSNSIEIATSECVTVPAAVGFWKRTIILPVWTLRELPPKI